MNKNISNHDIALKIFNEYRYSDKSCCSRTGHARMIINEGGAESALNLIMNSNAAVEAARQIAKKHIEKYFINHDNLDLL